MTVRWLYTSIWCKTGRKKNGKMLPLSDEFPSLKFNYFYLPLKIVSVSIQTLSKRYLQPQSHKMCLFSTCKSGLSLLSMWTMWSLIVSMRPFLGFQKCCFHVSSGQGLKHRPRPGPGAAEQRGFCGSHIWDTRYGRPHTHTSPRPQHEECGRPEGITPRGLKSNWARTYSRARCGEEKTKGTIELIDATIAPAAPKEPDTQVPRFFGGVFCLGGERESYFSRAGETWRPGRV